MRHAKIIPNIYICEEMKEKEKKTQHRNVHLEIKNFNKIGDDAVRKLKTLEPDACQTMKSRTRF